MLRSRLTAAVLAVLYTASSGLGLAACGGEDRAKPPAGSSEVKIPTPDGETLVGTLVGDGDVGVVIAHGANADRTHWYGAGGEIAAAGFKVLMIDLRGTGSSTGERRTHQDVDINAAADWLEAQGVTQTALIGSSMGATSVLVAGSQRKVSAIVGLSPPQRSFAMDAIAAVPAIDAPVMLAVAEGDTTFVASTRELAKALGIEPRLTSGSGHGTGQFADNPGLVGEIVDFLRTSTGTT